jgi:hypothetical protein
VIVASQHLQGETADLGRRLRALDRALGTLHYKRTSVTHPLLNQVDGFGDEEDGVDAGVDKLSRDVSVPHLLTSDAMERFVRQRPASSELGKLVQLSCTIPA